MDGSPGVWRENHRLRSAFANLSRRSVSFFRRPRLTETDAPEVWHEQARILASSQYLFGILGVSSTALIVLDFCRYLSPVTACLCGLIPLLYLLLALAAQNWERTQACKLFFRRATALLLFLGIAWGLLVYLLAGSNNSFQDSLLTGMAVAVVSTPMMTSPVSASLAFWAPSSLLCFLALAIRIRPFNEYMLMCFSGYLCFVWTGIMFLNRALLERSRSRIQLQNQNQTIGLFLKDYEESGSDWLWETDSQLRLRHFSPRLAQLLQKPPAQLIGMPLATLFGQAHRSGSALHPLIRLLAKREAFRELELTIEAGGRQQEWVVTGRPIYDQAAEFQGYRGVGTDVTEARQAERRAKHLATHDSLTGLLNRQHFMERLERTLSSEQEINRDRSRRGRAPGNMAALMLLDLDRFKEVNDRFGHAVGDSLLMAVAARLLRCVRPTDVIGRLGGDEFAIVAGVPNASDMSALAQRIVDAIGQRYTIQGIHISIGVSIGVCFPIDGKLDLPSLLHNADLAMYEAKAEGRGTWRLYRPELRQAHQAVVNMQFDLAAAIERKEFRVEYQPIFDLRTQELVGTEALLRWQRGGVTPIPPTVFIPIAENCGLISRIGEYVLHEACTAAAKWPARISVSVNVSASQLRNGFVNLVDTVLARSGLPANRLELEITESALLASNEGLSVTLQELRERGVRLALDDFGTGYSSLAYLTNFRFDDLKIDASFVRDLETQPTKQAVVRAIVQLASALPVPITAEGVETIGQAKWLKRQGIAKVQGFLYSRALSESALQDMVRHGRPLTWQLVLGAAASDYGPAATPDVFANRGSMLETSGERT